jgi:hypothetical protein
MTKLSHLVDGDWAEHTHPAVFELLELPQQSPRLISAAPGGDSLTFRSLINVLTPPFYLLYVLHTPRGEGEPGRYESPLLEMSVVSAFLDRFQEYLRQDGRWDLWIHSPTCEGTVVWDRHNLIHGYGPVHAMIQTLRALGFTEGEAKIPAPHSHHYRASCDEYARALLAAFDWRYSPLQPEDEQ